MVKGAKTLASIAIAVAAIWIAWSQNSLIDQQNRLIEFGNLPTLDLSFEQEGVREDGEIVNQNAALSIDGNTVSVHSISIDTDINVFSTGDARMAPYSFSFNVPYLDSPDHSQGSMFGINITDIPETSEEIIIPATESVEGNQAHYVDLCNDLMRLMSSANNDQGIYECFMDLTVRIEYVTRNNATAVREVSYYPVVSYYPDDGAGRESEDLGRFDGTFSFVTSDEIRVDAVTPSFMFDKMNAYIEADIAAGTPEPTPSTVSIPPTQEATRFPRTTVIETPMERPGGFSNPTPTVAL